MALPSSWTSPPSRAAVFGASSVTWNLGRLYSSTLTQVLPWMPSRVDHHPAHEAIARGREVAAEGTVVVRAQRLPGDLLAVDVAEDDVHPLVGQDLVVVAFLIDEDGDALVIDRLAGAIERAVGEEDDLLLRNLAGSC